MCFIKFRIAGDVIPLSCQFLSRFFKNNYKLFLIHGNSFRISKVQKEKQTKIILKLIYASVFISKKFKIRCKHKQTFCRNDLVKLFKQFNGFKTVLMNI